MDHKRWQVFLFFNGIAFYIVMCGHTAKLKKIILLVHFFQLTFPTILYDDACCLQFFYSLDLDVCLWASPTSDMPLIKLGMLESVTCCFLLKN